MGIIVIHGDNINKSFERLSYYKKSAINRKLEIRKITPADNISEKLTSVSLFGNDSLLVIEDIKRTNKKDLKWLKENLNAIDNDLILYEPSQLTRTILNYFPKAKIEEFKLPKLIWKFLDEFYPKNAKNTLKLLHSIIESEAAEPIIGLINWRLLDILTFIKNPQKILYDTWRLNKLENQSKKFSQAKVTRILEKLAKADYESKIGKADIITSLDLIIASELE